MIHCGPACKGEKMGEESKRGKKDEESE